MDELDLYYFVEGQEVYDVVNISKEKHVMDLRKLIYTASISTSYKVQELTLLKVCHKTSFFFFSWDLLTFFRLT
jgi:hypothetical protein